MRLAPTPLLAILLLALPAAAQDYVAGELKINELSGGFGGALVDFADFGEAVIPIGDLDGDNVVDLAVGAGEFQFPLDTGEVWILFLNADGTVKSEQKIDGVTGGFTGSLSVSDEFGAALAPLGDLDGDGALDLAVGAPKDGRGVVWILFLNTDGTVRSQWKIGEGLGGFQSQLTSGAEFGRSLANMGDLDGDGIDDLAVGAESQGAAWLLFLNANGTVKSERKIAPGVSGFVGEPGENDQLGSAVANPGDVDGDGRTDLVIGAPSDDDGQVDAGAAWVLLLNADGTVRAEQKISNLAGGFTGNLGQQDLFGKSVAALGDRDNDGVPDLAVGAPFDDDGGNASGAVWILLLRADGTVKRDMKVSSLVGGFSGPLQNGDRFGFGMAGIGDLDGDGVVDLAVGAPGDDGPGTSRGAVWILTLNCNASVVSRYGSGINPATLQSTSPPVLGAFWTIDANCIGHAPGLVVLQIYDRPRTGPVLGAGELLIDVFTGLKLGSAIVAHGGDVARIGLLIPFDPQLCGLRSFTQAACLGAPGAQLSNAVDLVLGF